MTGVMEVIMDIIGLLIALIMLVGLWVCFLMSLAVVDYVFDTDLKNWLCSHLPRWATMRKLRDYMVAKTEALDIKCQEEENVKISEEPIGLLSIFDAPITSVVSVTNSEEPTRVTTASGAVYTVVRERKPESREIIIEHDESM